MRVLLAVDSITTLEIVLDEMKSRSWPIGTEAHVLSIVEDAEVPLETWREAGYGVGGVRREMERRGEQIWAWAIDSLGAIGIAAKVTVMRGNPTFLIPFAAREWSVDLILIRAHNRTDFRNWLLGSVAKSVVECAPCSVEVVRTQPYSIGSDRGLRVVLATDGSDVSLAASQAIAATTWPAHTEVKVVSVINPVIYSLEEMGLSRERGTSRAHRAIGDAFQALKVVPLTISGEVIAGTSARQIIAAAKRWQADLIVVGSNERRGLKRFLIGSISADVAKEAHCSVRVIRGSSASRSDKDLAEQSKRAAHEGDSCEIGERRKAA